jgi:hypothetical protein
MIAKRFIQRRDVLAEQTAMQGYRPVREGKDGPLVPVTQRALLAHLSGDKTYGHYLLDTDDKCRVFAFDIDLEKNSGPDDPEPHHVGRWAQPPDMETWTGSEDTWTSAHVIHEFDARESWRDRRHPSRTYLKTQMRYLAGMLARTIHEELELPTAVTYTGAKGIHVYGFTDPLPAEQVREAAQIVLDSLDCFRPSKGKHFFKHVNTDPIDGYDNFSIEVFPKQTSIGDGGFGNLMRLPLGVNRKAPKDPTFFVDLRAPMSELVAHPNPLAILESGNPWLD